ncbi:hypothetical protein BN1708_014592, partial [Verticillium longisporum]
MPSTFSRLPSCDPSDRQDHAFESPNQDVQAPVICNHLSTDGCDPGHHALSQPSLNIVFHGIAHPAMCQDGPFACRECCLCRQVLGAICRDAHLVSLDRRIRLAAGIIETRCMVRRQLRRLQLHIRIRQRMGHPLIHTDRPAEHHPLASIRRRPRQRRIAQPESLARQQAPLSIHPMQDHIESLALLSY